MIFRDAWQRMLKLDLILQITNQIDRYQKRKNNKKVIGLMKDELFEKNIAKFLGQIARYM